MFETKESFLVFFFVVATILLIGILFEEKFLALEDKFDAWWYSKKHSNSRNK